MTLTAHDIAADPNLYAGIYRLGTGKVSWECLGYTPDGNKIKFARLLVLDRGIKQINRYVSPDTPAFPVAT